MLLLGLALGVLWVVGLGAHATAWLTWLDLAAAVLSVVTAIMPLGTAASAVETEQRAGAGLFRAPPLVVSFALLVLWIVGLAMGATAFMTWWTLAFAVAYGLLGVFTTRTVGGDLPTTTFPGARRV